ncbi:MAG TPA: hypothetical protein VMW38_06425 [Terriglobia bacterium]|nr:hypothetical protein [Terriglobia bacterium]
MAARPPNFNVRAGKIPAIIQQMRAVKGLPPLSSEELGGWLGAWLRMQWDRGGEQPIQRRHILQAQLFGLSIKAHWWDKVQKTTKYRYSTEILMKDRGIVEDEDGTLRIATQDEKEAGLASPVEAFSPEDRAEVMLNAGAEYTDESKFTTWEGPVSQFVFLGDFYPEPEFETLHSAAWITHDDFKNVEWLSYWHRKKYVDPDSGEERPVFDRKAVEDLIEMGSWDLQKARDDEFKQYLRDVLFQTRPQFSARLIPGKRFLVSTEHTFRDGVPWVRWIGNERILLGEMPYPFDLYGHYAFSALTPIPDLLYGIGDSPLVMMRALQKLHNVTVSQTTDELVNRMKMTLLVREGVDLPSEVLDREFMRLVRVKNLNDFKFLELPPFPAEANAQMQWIQAAIQQLEPAINDGGIRNAGSPDPARVPATTQLLAKAALDSLSSDEMSQLDLSLGEEAELKLYMLQQTMRDELDIPEQYFSDVASLRAAGSNQPGPRIVQVGPLDIQQDFHCFAESYSTLALDDIDRQQASKTIYAIATANPRVWNVHRAAELLATTFRGHSASELLNDPAKMPPPMPPIRLAINWKDLTPEEKAQFKERMGIVPGIGNKLAEENSNMENLHEAVDHARQIEQPEDALQFVLNGGDEDSGNEEN